jgi:membrane protease YdiL (CAAX protease family)
VPGEASGNSAARRPELASAAKAVNAGAIARPPDNPYRQLARRRFPEPLLLLLLFLLGVWLWDNHLGAPAPPHHPEQLADQWELAMRKADRDLRLAEGTRDMPDWLRSVLGIRSVHETLESRIRAFDQLVTSRQRHAETPRGREAADAGAYALGVLLALREDAGAATGPFQQLGLAVPPAPQAVLERIIRGQEYWWDLAYIESLGLPEAEAAAPLVEARTHHLVSTAIKTRGFIAALTFGGLVFVPGTLIAFLRAGKSPGPVRYSGRWTLSFGLGVFLLAYLAHLGFSLSFNRALETIAARPVNENGGLLLSMPLYIALDSLTRFLPALIALALLFRKIRHAINQLGLAGPFDGRMVLGSFALLQFVHLGLMLFFNGGGPSDDPTGGLSSVEAGAWGLLFMVFSACLAAPLAEEIVYRGVLFRSLANRLPLVAAVLLSSTVFALVHFYALPSLWMVGAVGVACALSYAASGSLLTAVALHALYNACIKVPEWIVYQSPLS